MTCQRLVETLAVEYVLVARSDPAGDSMIVAEYPARLGTGKPLSLAGSEAYRQLLAQRRPIVFEPAQPPFQLLDLQTLVIVPLVVQDDFIGFMILGARQPGHTFSQDEFHAIQTVTAQLAISLRNAELFTEVQRRANQLDQIAAFGRLVTSTLDRNKILQHVAEVLPSLLPLNQLGVALLTAGQSRMHVMTLNRGAHPEEEDLAAAGSAIEEVVQTQNPILIADLQSSTYTDHRRMAKDGVRSALVTPLTISGRAFGAVYIGHQRVRMYTPTDLTLLQQIGNQIAIALENARQFQTTQQRAQYEETLSEITSHLQQQGDLRVMLQQTMLDLGRVLGARRARVRLQVALGGAKQTKE